MKILFLIRSLAADAFTHFACSRLRARTVSSRGSLPGRLRPGRRRRAGGLLAFTASFLALLPFSLSAADYEWTGLGGGGGDVDLRWQRNAHWSGPSGRPENSDDVAIFDGEDVGASFMNVHFSNGTTDPNERHISELSFVTDASDETWKIYALETTTSSPDYTLWLEDKLTYDLANGGKARLFLQLGITNTVTWSPSGEFLILNEPLAGAGAIVPGAGSGGGITLKKAGTYSGTWRTGGHTIDIDHVDALRNATVIFDSSNAGLEYVSGANIGAIHGESFNAVLPITSVLNVGWKNTDAHFFGRTDGSGALRKVGSGRWTLNPAFTTLDHTGDTEVIEGTLRLHFTLTASALKVRNGGLLEMSHNSVIEESAQVDSGGVIKLIADAGIKVLAGEGKVDVDTFVLTLLAGGGGDFSFSGLLCGTGRLSKKGGGTFTFTPPAQPFSGIFQIIGGDCVIGDTTLQNATVDLNKENGLMYPDGATIGALAGNKNLDLSGNLNLGGNNGNTTYTGSFSGSGGFTKQGAGMFILSANHCHSGDTVVEAGVLRLESTWENSQIIVEDGATLLVAEGAVINSAVTVNSGGTVTLLGDAMISKIEGMGTVNVGDHQLQLGGSFSGSATFSGQFTGAGVIEKSGVSDLKLDGPASSFSGVFRITRDLGAGHCEVGSATLQNATVDLLAVNRLIYPEDATIGALSGDRGLAMPWNLNLGGNGADTTYTGKFSGPGGFTKQGDGIFILSDSHSHGGATVVEGGALRVESTWESSPITVGDDATLVVAAGAVVNSAVTVESGGAVQLEAGSAIAGSLDVGDGGMATLQGDAAINTLTGSGSSSVAFNGYNLTIGGDNTDAIFSGLLESGGRLIKTGSGTFTLKKRDHAVGADVQAGTLAMDRNGDSNIVLSDDLIVQNGASLIGAGRVGGTASFANGSTLAPGLNPGELGELRMDQLVLNGSYACKIDGANADQVEVDGIADLTNGTLDLSFANGAPNQAQYVLLTYGSLEGAFAAISNLPAGFSIDYGYNGNSVALVDLLPPDCIDITATAPGFVDSESVEITVTFSEPVVGFDNFAEDISLSGSTGTANISGADFSGSGDS